MHYHVILKEIGGRNDGALVYKSFDSEGDFLFWYSNITTGNPEVPISDKYKIMAHGVQKEIIPVSRAERISF